MNRLNGANCLIYSNDGIYKGKSICVIQIEEGQVIENPMSASMGNIKKIKIVVKNIKESLKNCKLTIFNESNGKYYALKNYEVRIENFNDEDAWASDIEENIVPKIKEIPKEEYEQLKTKGITNIEWSRIKTTICGENMTQDKAFENLCVDLINRIKITKEGSFHPRGGSDAGRDYIWKWPEIDNTSIDYLDLPSNTWVMQCKYSADPTQKLTQVEVWNEIVKVIQHNPNHYVIFTNRNITTSFKDWWDKTSELDGRKSKFIPFSMHMVGRDDIEKLLNLWHDIKEKYFEL